uniref:Uncharacterized protein n=1 Tax=Streptomyces sp. NBC_00008 TaxID=2903610 RepID=A0AAU2VQ94_9ACTN
MCATRERSTLALTVTAALLLLDAVLVTALLGRTAGGPVLPGKTDAPA